MKAFDCLVVLLLSSICVTNGGKVTEFHYERMIMMNETNEIFTYNIKSVDKINETSFLINSESDLLIDLNNDWNMAVEVYHNAENKEEFGEKPFMSIKKTPVCEFMRTFYKDKLYDKIKDYSNLPDPEQCPVKANHFDIKDYPFNGEKYVFLAGPGLWRIDIFLSQGEVTKAGAQILVKVTQQ